MTGERARAGGGLLRRLLAFVLEVGLAAGATAFVLLVILRPEVLRPPEPVRILQAPAPAGRSPGPASYAEAVAAAAPAVVNIYSRRVVGRQAIPEAPFLRRFFGEGRPRPRRSTSLGSGVIVDPRGHVLTNHHVIEGADEVLVALADGRTTEARLVGADPETDLALLRIDLPDLPRITVGRSKQLRVGDVVLAIGNPFGVGQTVTLGIVSATGRKELGISTFEDFIQTDAAINPGNSGGALVNARGELVGISTAIFTRSGGSQGVGFAIPTHVALRVLEDLVRYGRVIRGWLGVEIQDLTPALAESFGLDRPQGALVAGVLPGGPAERAGIRPGDVLVAVEGEPVADARAALDRIAALAPGTRVRLGLVRAGRPVELEARIGERPPPRAR